MKSLFTRGGQKPERELVPLTGWSSFDHSRAEDKRSERPNVLVKGVGDRAP